MKNILVPCDFSHPAVNAFRFALQIAAKMNARIHLLHAIELPVLNDPIGMSPMNFGSAYVQELNTDTVNKFDSLKNNYSSEATGLIIISKLVLAPPVSAILNYIVAESIDLIIMGSHGVNGLREIFLGSTAEKIVRRSSVPVLVIKNYFKGPVTDIVFPNLFEIEHQDGLIAKVKELQHFFEAKLHLVFINTPFNFATDDITFSRMKDFATHFVLSNYTLNVYNHSDTEEGIFQFTQNIKAQLAAMGTHGRNGIGHLINGSIAEDVVNHGDTLVWTFSHKNELVEA